MAPPIPAKSAITARNGKDIRQAINLGTTSFFYRICP